MDKTARMKELIAILNEASRAYYAQDREIMSNYEYDKLYDELVSLEDETGTVMAGSPTVSVGYEAVDELPKERHESPMLSLGKTKSREDLRDWLGEQKGLLSWKLDGLTIVLTYRDGQLFKAVTRGNGEIGEVITGNARVFVNLPLSIPFKGELVLRGEAVITYEDFRKINEQIEDADARYKNPRNLCSGSVRQLNNEITAQRNVRFFAFALVKADDVDFQNSRKEQFLFLQKLGFEDAYMTVADYRHYSEKLHCQLVPATELLISLRQSKDEEEIQRMIAAQRIAEAALDQIVKEIKPGVTEKEIAARLQYLMLAGGAENMSFDPIVASGPNGSMPHAVPTDRKIQDGDFVTMDFGCIYQGYCSDMTRTVAVGHVTEEMEKVYNVVLQAQLAGIAAAKAGATGHDVDAAARKVIEDAGYGPYFGHSFGHSVGVEIHESPNATPANNKPLPLGAAVSAEPGIYLPGRFGVRIEDVVVLQEDGCQDITLAKKDLLIL